MQENVSKNNNVHVMFAKENLDDTANGTKSKLMTSQNKANKSEIEKYKSKIIYTTQGWGFTDNLKQSKHLSSKVTKSGDKSLLSNSKDSKLLNKLKNNSSSNQNTSISISNLQNKNLKNKNQEIKIDRNQKLRKIAPNQLIKPLNNKNKKPIANNYNNNSDDDFFNGYDDF